MERLTASGLRRELAERGRRLAAARGLLHDVTPGGSPSVIFGVDERGVHGNFQGASFGAIRENAEWAKRLTKVHTAHKKLRARADWRWMELDCANSSDALLMNVFCFPGVLEDGRVAGLMGLEGGDSCEFGYRVKVPLKSGKVDRTEVDLRLGDALVEAKLTESGFQQARLGLVERYRDFEEVFEVSELEVVGGTVRGYQLIRGALAAYASGAAFCVLADGRRSDLVEGWWRVLRAVRVADLRWRLKMLTWQELAGVLPWELQVFLAEKYGIVGG